MLTQPYNQRVETPYGLIDPRLHSVSYVRVSTKDQASKGGEPDGLSLPAQREAIEAKAASGYQTTIRRHFMDKGESARTADRPGLQELLAYLSEHRVDYVFVHKLDRLARNRFDDIEITMAIQKSGARLVSVTENIDETPSGMLMHGIMSSIAEFYSRNLANEVKKGLHQKAKSGGTPGRAPIGYLNTRYLSESGSEVRAVIVDPERAPLVKLAFELYASGDYSIERLQKKMAEHGLTSRPTPKRPATPLSISQLGVMLRNPYYLGIVTYQGQRYAGRHEPLVDEQLYDRAQAVADHRSRQGSRDRVHAHFLKGLLLCQRCHEKGRRSRLVYTENPGRDGTKYLYYKCVARQHHGCNLPYLPVEVIERSVGDYLATVALPPDFADQLDHELQTCVDDEQRTTRDLHASLKKRLTDIDQQEERLLDLAAEGRLPKDKITSRLSKLATQRENITQQLTTTAAELEIGFDILRRALTLLRTPADFYAVAQDKARRDLCRALFTELRINEHGDVNNSTLNEAIKEVCSLTGKEEPLYSHLAPEGSGGNRAALVAGAGFEPATSGL